MERWTALYFSEDMTKAYYMNEKMEPVWMTPVEESQLGGGVAWSGGIGLAETKRREVLAVKEWLKEEYFRDKKSIVSGWWATEEVLEEVDGFEGWAVMTIQVLI